MKPQLIMTLSFVLANTAIAAVPAAPATAIKAATGVKGIKPVELTCEQFLAVDDITRPQLVYWAEGINSKGKPEDAVFDVERTNRLVPVLVEDCKQAPQTSFWEKMKVDFKKVF